MNNASNKGNQALNRARQNASAKQVATPTSSETKTFTGKVISVNRDSNGDVITKNKSNESVYMTCKVELDGQVHPVTGAPVVIAASRTLTRFNDEEGNPLVDEAGQPAPVSNSEVVEDQNVTVYVRLVEGVMYADVSTGSTDNSDADVISALGF